MYAHGTIHAFRYSRKHIHTERDTDTIQCVQPLAAAFLCCCFFSLPWRFSSVFIVVALLLFICCCCFSLLRTSLLLLFLLQFRCTFLCIAPTISIRVRFERRPSLQHIHGILNFYCDFRIMKNNSNSFDLYFLFSSFLFVERKRSFTFSTQRSTCMMIRIYYHYYCVTTMFVSIRCCLLLFRRTIGTFNSIDNSFSFLIFSMLLVRSFVRLLVPRKL